MAEYRPEWPDKAMFAAWLLIIGGILGTAAESLRAVATVAIHLPDGILSEYPSWLSAALALATLVLGVLSLRTQAAVFGYWGAATGLLSFACAGLLPFLSLLVLYLLFRSHLEGEETRNDGVKLHPSMWPDKAMAASLFMVVGGAVAGVQGVSIATGSYEPVLLDAVPNLAIAGNAAALAYCIVAARQVYHLRTAWMGDVAGIVCMLTLGIVVVGPAIGVAILTLMALARREREFAPAPPAPLRAVRTRRRAAPK